MWALDRGAYEESKNEASRKGFGRCQMPISQSLSRKLRTRSRKLMNAVPDDTHIDVFPQREEVREDGDVVVV